MKNKAFLLFATSIITLCVTGCDQKDNSADLVVYSPIYTAENENNSEAEAFAVKNGKFVYVGTKEGAKAYIKEGKTEVIDRTNKGLIIPGCTEGHAHYFDGVGLNKQLPGSGESYEKVLEILAKQYSTQGIKQFLSFGWKTVSLSKRRSEGFNFAKEIESKAPGIPVILIDDSGHSAVCNETALRMSGITKENPIVRGGGVDIDKDGNPTGYIGDQAVFYVVDKSISDLLTLEQYKNACEYGMNELLRFGYTNALDAFTNMYDPTGLYEALKIMDDEGKLKMNIAACYNIKSFDSKIYKTKIDEVCDIVSKYSSRHCNPKYIKLFADGVVESGTGWIFGTYKHAAEGKEHGNIIWEKSELSAITTYANSKDITIHTHAFGDAACDATIDAYLTSNLLNGTQYRNCLGHVRNIKEADIIRAAENKIPVAANLIWHTDYGPNDQDVRNYMIDNMGESMFFGGYPMKSLVEKGVIVSSSTDAPAAMTMDGNIQDVIEVSTTGIEPGYEIPPFASSELLTVREALQALTINGAWQLGLENERGSIKVGKYADFVMIDKDFLNYKGDELGTIHNAKILKTYFEGKNVFTYKPTSNPDSKFVS